MLHIHFSFTNGGVILLIHTATINQLYCLKMSLLGLKHVAVMHSVSAYLILMETVQLIMNI